MEVYNAEMRKYDKTRDIQWKFNIASWTLLGLGIRFREYTLSVSPSLRALIISGFVLLHGLFAYLNQHGLKITGSKAENIKCELNKFGPEVDRIIPSKFSLPWNAFDILWLIFQIGATIMLALFLIC